MGAFKTTILCWESEMPGSLICLAPAPFVILGESLEHYRACLFTGALRERRREGGREITRWKVLAKCRLSLPFQNSASTFCEDY